MKGMQAMKHGNSLRRLVKRKKGISISALKVNRLALIYASAVFALVLAYWFIPINRGSEFSAGEEQSALPVEELEPLIAPFYPTFENAAILTTMEEKTKYIYTIDETAYVYEDELDIQSYLQADLSTPLTGPEPKILIFHTHSREAFIDSRPGEDDDTVIGVGSTLADILSRDYHVPVVHDVGRYDVVNGREMRDGSYERMNPAVKNILDKYPSIEVTIDVHRDGVPDGVRLVREVNGLPTARMMFFNGITRLNDNGRPKSMPELVNPYIKENLALSLQLQLTANEFYPGLMRNVYIKPYRYSLALKPKSILVEVGANTSTVREAKNAMAPLAEILMSVLQEKD
ncbi:MAG: stage II sporulation protein P [Clostridiales bacterium]|jgi:stage II sporulation protein P|nr:stage II sporulation protein P [Clostridiales bacterium]